MNIPRRISFQAATALCAGEGFEYKKAVQWLLMAHFTGKSTNFFLGQAVSIEPEIGGGHQLHQ